MFWCADVHERVAYGEDFDHALLHAVDDAVVAEKNLANILTAKLPDHIAGKRKAITPRLFGMIYPEIAPDP